MRHYYMARKSLWTPENKAAAVDTILRLIATSEVGLNHICADEMLPSAGLFYEWKSNDKTIAERYALAREQQQHLCVDNAAVLATQLVARDPAYSVDPAAFRAYWDVVKWRASKLAPDYADKIKQEHSGTIEIPDNRKGVIERLLERNKSGG